MYRPKFDLGNTVKNNKYKIDEATIIGVEIVESNPRYNTIYKSVDDYVGQQNTAQYCLLFYDKDAKDVFKEWYYEEFIELI
jgi:hypothetical protein